MSNEEEYFAGTSEEGPFYVGPCKSIEEAKAEGAQEYADQLAEGYGLFIGKGRKVALKICGYDVIESIGDRYHDELYEDALSSWCDGITKEKKQELGERLTKVFHEWLKENDEQIEFTVIDLLDA